MQSMKDKFLGIKEKIEDDNEKLAIEKEIEKDIINKTTIFLEMSQLLYKKIRNREIVDSDFEKYCEEIFMLDKQIYGNKMKIKDMDENVEPLVCSCGNVVGDSSKFCGECGNKIEEVIFETQLCSCCENEMDIENKYCNCCGMKL